MKRITRLFAVVVAACMALGVNAQEQAKYHEYPHAFVTVQGGAQLTCTDHMNYKKMMRPILGVSVGGYFNRAIGMRVSGQGWTSAGYLSSIEQTYDYKYATGNVDLLLNLTNLFSSSEKNRFFNVILLGGVGLTYAWDNDELPTLNGYTEDNLIGAWEDDLLSHNFRAGMQLAFRFSRYLDLNIEGGVNSLSDKFNSKKSGKDDWQPYLMAGLTVKFGHKKVKEVPAAVVEEPVVEPEPVWETRIDTIWYDEPATRDIEVEESLTRNVKFPLRGADAASAEQLQVVADFVKSHKGCKVDVKAYADKGTGSAKSNMKYSEQRRQSTVDALVERGVPAELITSKAFGDTVQPFEKNDDNRVSVVTVTGKLVKKEQYKVRKFRTEERRVRVQ